MRESPPTVRGFVARDGAVLLKQAPAAWPAHWLADLLRQLEGCEILVTVTCVGETRPDWLPTATLALERPTWAVAVSAARQRALGPGACHDD